ncbi:hypothetical protein CapIbe_008209 [Capra ibex]
MKLVFNQRIMLNIVQSLIQNCQSPFSASVTTVGPVRVTALLRRGEEVEAYILENLEGGRFHVLKSKAHLAKSRCFTTEQDIKHWIILSSSKFKKLVLLKVSN